MSDAGWHVKLWINNEQGSYNALMRLAGDVFEEVEDATIGDDEWWDARTDLEELLKEFTEDYTFSVFPNPEDPGANLAVDLITSALGQVDYREWAGELLLELKDEWTADQREAL